jgi:hypothetical protein
MKKKPFKVLQWALFLVGLSVICAGCFWGYGGRGYHDGRGGWRGDGDRGGYGHDGGYGR